MIAEYTFNFIDIINSKYYKLKDLKNRFVRDFRKLFNYSTKSINRIIYKSRGIFGIYSDVVSSKNNLCKNFVNIKDNFKTLENILINNNLCSNNYINNNTNNNAIADFNCAKQFSFNTLNEIIYLKNKHFWKNTNDLSNLIKNTCGIEINSVDLLVRDMMVLKTMDTNYSNISSIYYDSRIAPQSMKDDIINLYLYSDKTLEYLSSFLEKRYGMHIASSTISVNARKYLSLNGLIFKNRKDAKKYYVKNVDKNNIILA